MHFVPVYPALCPQSLTCTASIKEVFAFWLAVGFAQWMFGQLESGWKEGEVKVFNPLVPPLLSYCGLATSAEGHSFSQEDLSGQLPCMGFVQP